MGEGSASAAGEGAVAQSQTAQTAENAAAENNGEKEVQAKKSGRDRLLERYAKKYPDRKFEGDNADNDLYDLTADEFDNYEKDKSEYSDKASRLNQLFKDFPDSADIFKAMAVDKTHPFDYIIDHYWDILEDGLQKEENRTRIKQRRDEKAKFDSEREGKDAEFEKNIKESLRILGEWGKRRGLDDKAQAEHFLKLRQLYNDFSDGNISEETYEQFFNGANYASDVAKAKEEGEVNGRNAKIQSEFQHSKAKKMPPTLGGQGGSSEEYDEAKKGDILPMFGIPIKSKK